MSQTITNLQGQQVEVLDKGDLNEFKLWAASQIYRLWAWAIGVLLTSGIAGLLWFARQTTNTTRDMGELRKDVTRIETAQERTASSIVPLKSTMDSLLIELRATQRQLSRSRP